MILIGQYDSPFVRRVGITLHRYKIPYEHRAWSVWGDAEKISEHNPLRRVPTLLLDDGTALLETFSIIDALDEVVGPERALLPAQGPVRREGLRIAALSSGLADKAVSLLYERLFRDAPAEAWVERCKRQITSTLEALEADRVARSTPHWLGLALTHADVAFGCAFRFLCEAHPSLAERGRYPALEAQAARCEELEEFRAVVQAITNDV
jgi:glutathione S-transferase